VTDEQALFMIRGIVAKASDEANVATVMCKVEPISLGGECAFKASWINSISGKWQSATFLVDGIKNARPDQLINIVVETFKYMKSDTGSEVQTS